MLSQLEFYIIDQYLIGLGPNASGVSLRGRVLPKLPGTVREFLVVSLHGTRFGCRMHHIRDAPLT